MEWPPTHFVEFTDNSLRKNHDYKLPNIRHGWHHAIFYYRCSAYGFQSTSG